VADDKDERLLSELISVNLEAEEDLADLLDHAGWGLSAKIDDITLRKVSTNTTGTVSLIRHDLLAHINGPYIFLLEGQ